MFLYYTNITADHSFRDRYFNREVDFLLLVSTFRDINRDIYSLSVQLIQNLPKPPNANPLDSYLSLSIYHLRP